MGRICTGPIVCLRGADDDVVVDPVRRTRRRPGVIGERAVVQLHVAVETHEAAHAGTVGGLGRLPATVSQRLKRADGQAKYSSSG